MKRSILMATVGCICLLSSACNSPEFPTRQLQEVKVVGHVPYRDEGSGIGRVIIYDHWIYENTSTKERFTLTDKYGEVGDVVKIRR